MPPNHPPPLSYAYSCQSRLRCCVCVCVCVGGGGGPPSGGVLSHSHRFPGLVFFSVLDYRCQQLCLHSRTGIAKAERYSACRLLMPREAAPTTHWREGFGKNSSLFPTACIFLYERTLIILILHLPSGRIGPSGVRGSTFAASSPPPARQGITADKMKTKSAELIAVSM